MIIVVVFICYKVVLKYFMLYFMIRVNILNSVYVMYNILVKNLN